MLCTTGLISMTFSTNQKMHWMNVLDFQGRFAKTLHSPPIHLPCALNCENIAETCYTNSIHYILLYTTIEIAAISHIPIKLDQMTLLFEFLQFQNDCFQFQQTRRIAKTTTTKSLNFPTCIPSFVLTENLN